MSPSARANLVRWGALAIGLVLFAASLYYINFDTDLQTVRRLGLAVPLALFFSGLWHLARTWAWSWCFPPQARVSFLRLARVRLAAEAFSYLTLRGIAGEPLKVVLLNDRVDPRAATAAVALERLAYMIGTTIIVGLGSAVALAVLPLTPIWFRVFRAFAIGAAVIGILTALVISGKGSYFASLLEWWDVRFGTSAARGRVGRFLGAVERHMLDLVRGNPRRLVVLLTATVASYVFMALEAWVILQASGTPVSAIGALTVETFSRVASFASAFIPANLGALEASSLAAVAAIGATAGGAALALTRRLRGLFWAGVGLAIYPRGIPRPVLAAEDRAADASITGPFLLYVMRDAEVRIDPHVRLAALPLSERILRAALKAGYSRVIVSTGGAERRTGQSSTGTTDRRFERLTSAFGNRVVIAKTDAEWRASVEEIPAGRPVLAVGAGTLVSPALLREGAELGTLASATVDVPAGPEWPVSGLLRVSRESAADLQALAAALRERSEVAERPTGDDVSYNRARLAIRLVAPSDVPGAEFNLRRSCYKDTDARFARFNRGISVPISVVLMRTPLTANQLSVMLVAIGFYSGWLFSFGEYWPGVLAGFLSLAASVLDGCDGEIARLKYQESALGCWIETVGDYSYYIAIFAGLTVGSVRQTGFDAFYWIGGAAMAGTLLTFALLIYIRARITNGQPNRLNAIAGARFNAEQSFWVRIIWRVQFLATRAAMPYAIMAMALLYILPVITFLAAVGSNIFWVSLVLKLRDILRDEETVTA